MAKSFMSVGDVNVFLASDIAPEVIPDYSANDSIIEILRKVTQWALRDKRCVLAQSQEGVLAACEVAECCDRIYVILVDVVDNNNE